MRTILENLDEILPLVIFVIIAIGSAIAKNKRGQKTDDSETDPASEPSPSPSPSQQQQTRQLPTSTTSYERYDDYDGGDEYYDYDNHDETDAALYNNDNYDPDPKPANASANVPIDDELRRTLEDIFLAKKPPPKQRSQNSHTSSDTAGADNCEWQKTVDRNNARTAADIKARAQTMADRKADTAAATAATAAIYAVDRTHNEIECIGINAPTSLATTATSMSSTSIEVSIAQARNGFVWSEVLGTPVGMR